MTNWMYVKKDLLELVENDFKEYEEIALEEAKKQTKADKGGKKADEKCKMERYYIGNYCCCSIIDYDFVNLFVKKQKR